MKPLPIILTLILLIPYAFAAFPSGFLHGYKMDDTSDVNGTVTLNNTGGVAFTNSSRAHYGNAAGPFGAGQVLSAYSNLDISGSTLSGFFTVSLWVKPSSLPATQAFLFFVETTLGGNKANILQMYNNSGTQQIIANCGAAAGNVEYNVSLSLNDWHSLALVKDDTLTCLLYVDGILAATNPAGPAGDGYDYVDFGAYDFLQPSPILGFDGQLDSVYVYDRGLNASEILDINNSGGEFDFVLCITNWTCTGYSAMCEDGEQECNAVTDENVCGDSYAGNYSEFTPQNCSDTQYTFYTPANASTHTSPVLFNVTITSNSSLPLNCDLQVDAATEATNIISSSPSTFAHLLNLSIGAHSWYVNCSDATTSATRTLTVCVANYTCSGYGACAENLTAACNAVMDENTCGYTYTGDYTEFSRAPCTLPPTQASITMSTMIFLLVILFFLYMADSLLPTKSPQVKELFRYAYVILLVIGIIAVIGMAFGV